MGHRMRHQIQSSAIAGVVALWQSAAFAAQTWTYQFTPIAATQPYHVSCGECGPPYEGSTADVAGTFTILLDWDNHQGKIVELSDHLVNVVDIFFSRTNGPEMVPSNPPTKDYGIIPPWALADYPQFATSSVTYSNGLGHMKSDGAIRLPNGSYRSGLPYEVWFTPTAATLNMTVPIDDWHITVTGAFAAFQSSAWSGDLNHDGRVDSRDYVMLRNSTGAAADYDAWRWSYGNVYFGGGVVPEPTSALLLLAAFAACFQSRRRAR